MGLPRANASLQLVRLFNITSPGKRFKSLDRGPLHGVRILDMSRVLAGPFASMILGDMGAEIIKVEKPGAGDETRMWGPPFVNDQSVYFLSVNRNKKSICIDFKKPKGIKVVQELAAKCDVLMENFVPGKLKAFGLDYESLKPSCPELIYCSISGFGETGPYANRAGYDTVVSAMGGLMHITGPEGGGPCRVGVAVTDIATGLYAHGAIMGALIERQRTGLGSKISCSLLASQIGVLSHIAANYLNSGVEPKRLGTSHGSLVPYKAFKTKDGDLVIGVGNDAAFKKLCMVLDLPWLAEEEKYATNQHRVENRGELISVLSKRLLEQKTSYWESILVGTSIPYGPINSIKEVFENPQVDHLGLVQTLQHPTCGEIQVPGPAVAYASSVPGVDHQPPPLHGQHTRDILTRLLDYNDDDINELVAEKVLYENNEASET